MIPDVDALTTAVQTQLLAGNTNSSRLDVFVGEPVAVMDGDNKAHPYVAVYPSPGTPDRAPLATAATGLLWSFQTTCAGGDVTRALRALTRTRTQLEGQRLVVDGLVVGVLHEREFYDPGPLRQDTDVAPPRWWTPLQWDVLALNA